MKRRITLSIALALAFCISDLAQTPPSEAQIRKDVMRPKTNSLTLDASVQLNGVRPK